MLSTGNSVGRLSLSQGRDNLGATSTVNPSGSEEGDIAVLVEPGDELIKAGVVPLPNAIKIDTEGFEQELAINSCD